MTATETAELWDSSVRLREVISKLKDQAGTATHFVIFDACRNTLQLKDPGAKSLTRAKGFEPVRKVKGMLIAYATAEGRTADDGKGSIGPYAEVLAKEIVRPDIEAVTMFRNVQLAVARRGRQEPWLTYGALGETYLAGRQKRYSCQAAEQAWSFLQAAMSRDPLERFIAQYPDCPQSKFALALLQKITKNEPSKSAMAPRSRDVASLQERQKRTQAKLNDLLWLEGQWKFVSECTLGRFVGTSKFSRRVDGKMNGGFVGETSGFKGKYTGIKYTNNTLSFTSTFKNWVGFTENSSVTCEVFSRPEKPLKDIVLKCIGDITAGTCKTTFTKSDGG